MFDTANPAVIFLPMLAVVALTFIAFFKMAAARAKAAKEMPVDFYRAHIGDPEPEYARSAVRHYDNLLELPTLFYAACLTAFVLDQIGGWTLIFAWAYAVMRIVQSLVHMSYNNPAHRGIGFALGAFSLLALWVNIAMGLFANL